MIDRNHIEAFDEVLHEAAQVRHVLAKEVGRVLAASEGEDPGAARILRLSVPLEGIDPLHWLQLQPEAHKIYWAGRGEGTETAAVGVADTYTGPAERYGALHEALLPLLAASDPAVRYYGGMRFSAAAPSDPAWAPFGGYRFILPRFELISRGARGRLACNLVLPRDRFRRHALLDQIRNLPFPAHPLDGSLPLPLSRRDSPDEDGWRTQVRWALSAFSGTPLDKVVLARKVDFTFPGELDAALLLKHLRAATPGCFHFLFQVAPGLAFVGASPERLFRREGRSIRSEAVAGTRPRGASAADDARLRRELLFSDKDQREHAYVRKSIEASLGRLCERLDVDAEPSEMALARGRHLFSGARGVLQGGATDFDVLGALHPTPAVGGYPTAEALAVIRSLEAFDRGWYAGPVGWIGTEAAEFAVAIRSGLVHGRQLSLFSGAGIVPGSTPEGEWEEIEHKISDFINVLGLDLRRAKY